jgi:DNA-binding CsgD family transcriptional regulator
MSDQDTSIRPVRLPPRQGDATPTLTVIAGAASGQVLVLSGRETTVGRGDDVALRLPDAGVSRHHAKFIVASDGNLTVLDLDSTNGTFVNDVRVELRPLRTGDTVRIGPDAVLRVGPDLEPARPEVAPAAGAPSVLSARELEVACLVAAGLKNAEIAARLGLSARTITSHLDHIYARLGITSRAALTRHIIEAGLLPAETPGPPPRRG